MLVGVRGVYRNGRIELTESPNMAHYQQQKLG